MYKPASKLPHWQQESSPSYRRAPLSRRYRLFIVFAIFLLLCYRYSGSDVSEESREIIIKSNIAHSYPVEREKLLPPVASNLERKVEPAERSSVGSPALILERNEHEDQAPAAPPVKEVSPEYTGEDIPRKQAVLDTRRKGDSGPSDIMEHEPPALVKQASEKLIEQHLTPAVKYDEVKEEKDKSAHKIPSQKSGPKRFPSYSEYVALDEKGEALPDIVHVPFEDSTADVRLQGWEDQWYSDAELDIARWGKIPETKIDFVYTCKSPLYPMC